MRPRQPYEPLLVRAVSDDPSSAIAGPRSSRTHCERSAIGDGYWPNSASSKVPRFPMMGVIRADFGEFSARSYAKPVFRYVVRVSVIVAPEGILLIVHVANNRRRDKNDSYAAV